MRIRTVFGFRDNVGRGKCGVHCAETGTSIHGFGTSAPADAL